MHNSSLPLSLFISQNEMLSYLTNAVAGTGMIRHMSPFAGYEIVSCQWTWNFKAMVFHYESKCNSKIRVTYGIFWFRINYKGQPVIITLKFQYLLVRQVNFWKWCVRLLGLVGHFNDVQVWCESTCYIPNVFLRLSIALDINFFRIRNDSWHSHLTVQPVMNSAVHKVNWLNQLHRCIKLYAIYRYTTSMAFEITHSYSNVPYIPVM